MMDYYRKPIEETYNDYLNTLQRIFTKDVTTSLSA